MKLEMIGSADHTNLGNEGTSHHVIQMSNQGNAKSWVASMESKINQPPKLLNELAGKEACCIFKVPPSIARNNKYAYRPHLVSIGPYYFKNKHLEMIQEHKWRYLHNVLTRMGERGSILYDVYQVIKLKEQEIRSCYSEKIGENCDELVEMMVLDGCFIIELFWKVHQSNDGDGDGDCDDPLLKMAWVRPFVARDLLKLENQIPFFLLETLVEQPILALGENAPSMKFLTLRFFNDIVGTPSDILDCHDQLPAKHILDLFRLSMVTSSSPRQRRLRVENNGPIRQIPSAKKLELTGVKFMAREGINNFLDVEFENGVLRIPNLMLDDFYPYLLLNCIAFEQCYHYCSNDVTSYVTFMGCLINTPKDAEFLCDKKIIDNYFGTHDEVAYFFKNIGKDLPTDIHESYLMQIFKDVNEYSTKGWHVYWAGFVSTYFRSKWSIISAIVGSLVLLSTMIQALFAIFSYTHPPKK